MGGFFFTYLFCFVWSEGGWFCFKVFFLKKNYTAAGDDDDDDDNHKGLERTEDNIGNSIGKMAQNGDSTTPPRFSFFFLFLFLFLFLIHKKKSPFRICG